MTPCRIAVACFPTLGGSGIVATEVGCRLAARGHEVRFFAAEPPARLHSPAPRVSFQRVRSSVEPPLDLATYPLALASALAEAVTKDGFDVIHAHYAVPHAASAVLARAIVRRAGHSPPRLVSTLHGTDVTVHGTDPALRAVVRHVAAESDALSVPSAWLRDRAVEHLGLGEASIAVIRNFIDPSAFKPQDGDLRELFPHLPGWEDAARRPRVLFHGSSFRPLKRVGDAVRALATISQTRNVALVLVGDGPERPRVQALAESLGVAARVRFLGLLPHFADLLARADLFVLPSETESFGLAALEALASGVPVVASAVGGIPEVVRHGETGLLVPPADPNALAAACLSLFEDAPRRRKMAEAARADAVHRFDPEPTIIQYENLLCPTSSS
jgi:N-acetyl-alpha-D-glucosaminyl L-malate synthase BshA